MSEKLKERSEMDSAFMWDLTPMYANDEAWEKAFAASEKTVLSLSEWQGSLKDAASIKEFLDEKTAMEREMNNLFTYASLRNSEDTRNAVGQGMYSRAYGRITSAAAAIAFFEPELLAKEEEELKAIVKDPVLRITGSCWRICWN